MYYLPFISTAHLFTHCHHFVLSIQRYPVIFEGYFFTSILKLFCQTSDGEISPTSRHQISVRDLKLKKLRNVASSYLSFIFLQYITGTKVIVTFVKVHLSKFVRMWCCLLSKRPIKSAPYVAGVVLYALRQWMQCKFTPTINSYLSS